jgi:hypothetical protein
MKDVTAVVDKQSKQKCEAVKCSENETTQRYYGQIGIPAIARRSFSPSASPPPCVSRRGVGRGIDWIVYRIQSANRIDRTDWAVDGFLLRARVSAIRANGTGPGPSVGEMDVLGADRGESQDA